MFVIGVFFPTEQSTETVFIYAFKDEKNVECFEDIVTKIWS